MLKLIKLIMLIIAPFGCNSENFLEPKPIKWEELKEIHLDVVKKLDTDFQLSPACPQNIESYKSMSKKTYIQNILWTTYVWYEYKLFDSMRCIVLVEDFSNYKNEKLQVLSTFDATILLSASKGEGFQEKGYYDYANRINETNSRVSNENRNSYKQLNETSKNSIYLESRYYENIVVKDAFTSITIPQQNYNENFDDLEPNQQEVKSRSSVSHEESFTFPYYNSVYSVASSSSNFPSPLCDFLRRTTKSSGFFITENVSLVTGHSVYGNECGFYNRVRQSIAVHLEDDGFPQSHFPDISAANIQITNGWIQNPVATNPNDYAAIRFNESFYAPLHIILTEYEQLEIDDTVSYIGYTPSDEGYIRMWDYNGVVNDIFPNLAPSQFSFDNSPNTEVFGGISGSPVFSKNVGEAIGNIHGSFNPPSSVGIVNGFTYGQLQEIYSWLNWHPTAIITFPNVPINGGSYNLTQVPPFEVIPKSRYRK